MLLIPTLAGAQRSYPHPIFTLDENRLIAAYEKGRADAKRKLQKEKLLRFWSKDLGKVRSPEGESWTTSSARFEPPYMDIYYSGWNDQREYRDDTDFRKIVKGIGSFAHQYNDINFSVRLFAWPGISDLNHSINRAANREDIENVKFALLVDGKQAIHPVVRPTANSVASYDGSVTIPETHVVQGSSTTTSSASASGSGGSATATAWSSTTSTVTYNTYRTDNYAYHIADYKLRFSLRDKTGAPYVMPTTKTLVLKVIRRNGEMGTTFKLDDYKAYYK